MVVTEDEDDQGYAIIVISCECGADICIQQFQSDPSVDEINYCPLCGRSKENG
jgi:hypothetical protein